MKKLPVKRTVRPPKVSNAMNKVDLRRTMREGEKGAYGQREDEGHVAGWGGRGLESVQQADTASEQSVMR